MTIFIVCLFCELDNEVWTLCYIETKTSEQAMFAMRRLHPTMRFQRTALPDKLSHGRISNAAKTCLLLGLGPWGGVQKPDSEVLGPELRHTAWIKGITWMCFKREREREGNTKTAENKILITKLSTRWCIPSNEVFIYGALPSVRSLDRDILSRGSLQMSYSEGYYLRGRLWNQLSSLTEDARRIVIRILLSSSPTWHSFDLRGITSHSIIICIGLFVVQLNDALSVQQERELSAEKHRWRPWRVSSRSLLVFRQPCVLLAIHFDCWVFSTAASFPELIVVSFVA